MPVGALALAGPFGGGIHVGPGRLRWRGPSAASPPTRRVRRANLVSIRESDGTSTWMLFAETSSPGTRRTYVQIRPLPRTEQEGAER